MQNLTVLTYSRVSTSNKDQKPEVQVHELRRYCKARGWKIAHEIVDHGFSGGTENRPGFKKLMALARERRVDVVVVVKMDRLFRSLKHLVATLEEWQSLGVQFVATKDSIDYTTPGGRLFAQILGSLAEFEKSLLVERTKMGLDHARANGKILGRPRVRDDKEILKLRSQGLSYTGIERQLGISRGAIYRAIKSVSKTPPKQSRKTQTNQRAIHP
jgi:DNA invertase Pin-like site-specific DNA recombinase